MVTLVLLPGMDGTGSLFSDFVSALGSEFETILVHYPDDEPLAYTELEGVVRAFLPCDRPFILLGESFSGPIAISLSVSAPPGLIGLILCCSFAINPWPLLGVFRWLVPFALVKRVPIALLSKCLLGRFSSGPLRSSLSKALDRVSAKALKARLSAALETDVLAHLRRLRVPILYLRASDDYLVPRAASERIRRSAPQVRVAELKAPHFLLQAMPRAAAAVVSEFSREVAKALNNP